MVVGVLGVSALLLVWRMLSDSGNILTHMGRVFAGVGGVLLPFFVGAILAYIFLPFVRFIEKKILAHGALKKERRKGLRRGLAVMLTLVAVGLLVAALIASIVPVFVENTEDFLKAMPGYITTAEKFIGDFIEEYGLRDHPSIETALQSMLDYAQAEADTILPQVGEGVMRAVRSVTGTFVNAFVALISSIYFMIDGERMLRSIKRFIRAVLGEERAQKGFELGRLFDSVFGSYMRARLLETLVVGLVVFASFVGFGIPYSALFAVVNGLLNLIPYFGPIVGWVITVLVLLLIDPVKALYAGIIVLVLQQIDGYVLGPKLMGDSLNLRPLYIMLSVIAGGALFGVAGMLLTVPFVAFAGTLLSRYIEKRIGPYPESERPIKTKKRKKNAD